MKTIWYKGNNYPLLQTVGNAAKFARPFALEYCKGNGFDVGCNRAEWALIPDAMLIDPELCTEYHASNLPNIKVDYICSSHMLEHVVGRWQDVIEYWLTFIRPGGNVFLYLPNMDYQKYWAWGNKKHTHYINPAIMRDYCEDMGYSYIVTDGYDLNGSFYCVIEKA